MKDALGRTQTLLVLGGTSEIGLALAAELQSRGPKRIVLAGRDLAGLEGAAAPLRDLGAEVSCIEFDAADRATHHAVVERACSLLGDIDVAVIAFGQLGVHNEMRTNSASACHLIDVNLTGAISVAVPLVECLRRQGHGTVVALSSVAAERARKDNYVYAASKAGFDAFFSGLADELHGSGVNVVVVRPGFVHTKMTEGLKPAPFSTEPGVVAVAAANAIEAGRALVWAPAPLRVVMSGLRHLPRPIFRRLSN